ncbi:hypothetical protein [Mycoplasma struthionis]|uniref:hypothetical protein n=1 Tax=Mycoplasma struthionis TaxID=538220 RepID=UPI0021BD381C|nr:hypothetical protein [Mycoplasma struthionis]
MPPSSINQRLTKIWKPGDNIDVYIEEVKPDSKNAQVIVSSVDSKLLNRLFEKEIPEIEQGLVEIVKIARIPGERSKVAIKKTDLAPEGLEEVGAIMGNGSERIDAISHQLKGEKIDVILYSDDIKDFIINAISPAKVIDIIQEKSEDSSHQAFTVIVPNSQHTLAIGKKGQNVSLASELVKARLNILSQKQADEQGIKYNFSNGNITLEQIQILEEGKKLQSNFKKKNIVSSKPSFSTFENSFNIDEFDEDLAELRKKAQETNDVFSKNVYSSNPLELDDELENALSQMSNDLEQEEDQDTDPYSESISELAEKEKVAEEDYEKITSTKMKDFKRDDDLSAGLEDLDLSDLEDEDW